MYKMSSLTDQALQWAKITYLVTDDSNTIIATSNASWAGRTLQEAVPALVGMEDALHAVRQGQVPEIHLPYIALATETTPEYTYFSFYITAYPPTEGLFVIIREDTEIALLLQQLNQQYNELALLHEKVEQYARQLTEANQQLKDLNQERAFLISMINHDIRTPLAVIQNLLTALSKQGTTLTSEQRHDIEMALAATRNARELADMILQIERIHQATHTAFQNQVEVAALVREVIHRYQPAAAQDGIKVLTILRAVPPILGDWVLLREALGNVLDNAIKYNKPNGTIIIRLEAQDQGVLIEVEDTGVGFETKDVTSLFQPFQQGHTKTRRRGSGLGLYIAHRIVTLHRGRMWVQSHPQEGSRVFIWLPEDPAQATAADAQ